MCIVSVFTGPEIVLTLLLGLGLSPILISWMIYRRQKKNGSWKVEEDSPAAAAHQGMDPSSSRFVKIFSSVVLVLLGRLCVFLVVCGKNYSVTLTESALRIDSSLSGSVQVKFDEIRSVHLEPEVPVGSKVWGYAAMDYDLGDFENREFGRYKRYTSPDSQVIVVEGEKGGLPLVFSLENDQATAAFYQQLAQRISS